MMKEMDNEEDVMSDQEGLLDRRRKPGSKNVYRWCHRFTKTVCLSLAFFTLGLCIAIPGPTLIDLQDRIQSDTTHTALIFTARSIGYLMGSLVGGFLFDYFDKQLMLTMTLFVAALATSVIPWSLTLTVLSVNFALQGISMGVLDTGGNVFCVRIWGKKSPPYMQAMHFAFGIGAFIAPLLSQPFLSDMPILSVSTKVPANFINPLDTLQNNSRHVRDIEHNNIDSAILNIKNASTIPHDQDFKNMTHGNESESVGKGSVLSTTTQKILPILKFKKPSHSNSVNFKKGDADGTNVREHLNKAQHLDKSNNSPKPPAPPSVSTQKPSTKAVKVRLITNSTETDNSTLHEEENSTLSSSKTSTALTKKTDPSSTSKSPQISGSTNVKMTSKVGSTNVSTTTAKALPTTLKTTTTTLSTAKSKTSSTTRTTSTISITTTTTAKIPSTTTLTTTEVATTGVKTATTKIPTTTTLRTTKLAKITGKPKTSKSPDVHSGKTPKSKVASVNGMTSVTVTSSTSNITENNMGEQTTTTVIKKPAHSISGIITSAVDAVKNMSRIQFAYLIIGALLLLNSFLFITLYCYDRRYADYSNLIQGKIESDQQEILCCRIVILVLMFFFFMSYVGMETTFGGLLMTFVVHEIHWSKDQGAILTAIFWGSLAAGRGFSIFISNCCKPPVMLIVDLLLLVIGALMLSFGLDYEVIVWGGTLAVGFGMSSIFPTSITWMEQYYRMTGKSTAVLVMGSAVGQMIVPVATGYFYQNVEPMALMYSLLVLSVLMTILYLVMQLIASRAGARSNLSHNGFMHLRDDDNLELDDISYGTTTQDSTRRRFMPTFSDEAEYNQLLQDEDDDIDLLG